jgi:hypothetical protein
MKVVEFPIVGERAGTRIARLDIAHIACRVHFTKRLRAAVAKARASA